MLSRSGKSNATNSVTMNVNLPLLGALFTVVSTAIADHVVLAASKPVIIVIVSLLFFATIGYTVYELVRQVLITLRDKDAASSFCTSVFLSCLLLSFVALLLADTAPQSFTFSIILSISSLGVLLICTTLKPSSTLPLDQKQLESDPHPAALLAPPLPQYDAYATMGYQNRTQMAYRPPFRQTPPEDPPPLFLDDDLYRLPQPRSSRFFSIARANDSPNVFNEDACVISPKETRFALSDGAGASSLPRPWAALLGYQWTKQPFYNANILTRWLEEPRHRWRQWIQETWWQKVTERNQLTGDPPVSQKEVEQILSQGAFATFLGLELDRQGNRWRATAIGDTCLLFIQRKPNSSSLYIADSMPLTDPVGFNQTPPLLSSSRINNRVDHLLPHLQFLQGTYQNGDFLLMATDALAQWLLLQRKNGEREWQKLLQITDQQSFAQFIEQLREQNEIEEDDTTLVVIPL